MDDGTEPASETSTTASRLKHVVNLLGALNLVSELSLIGLNVALGHSASRRLIAR